MQQIFLYGVPGVGKTTIAQLIAGELGYKYAELWQFGKLAAQARKGTVAMLYADVVELGIFPTT